MNNEKNDLRNISKKLENCKVIFTESERKYLKKLLEDYYKKLQNKGKVNDMFDMNKIWKDLK